MVSKIKRLPDNRKAFNSAGMRFTHQRALLLELIRQGKGHLDADELYRRGRKKQPHLSLSTVYRTLQHFKKPKPSTEHYHLLCLGCGKVVEFHYPVARYVQRKVPEVKDFEIISTEVRMTGYCSRCRQDKK